MTLTVEALAQEFIRLDGTNGIVVYAPKVLATALLPFIERHIAAGQRDDLFDDLARIYATVPKLPVTAETAEEATNALLAFCYLPAVRKALDLQILPPAPLGDAEDYLRPLRNAIGAADAYATGGPRSLRIVTLRMDEAEAMLARASLTTPQPPQPAAPSLTSFFAYVVNALNEATGGNKWQQEFAPLELGPAASDAIKALAVKPKPAGAVPLPESCHRIIASPGRYADGYTHDQLIAYGDAREAAGRADAVPSIDPHALLSAYVRRCIGHDDDAPAEYRIEAMREALEEVGAAVNQKMTTQGEAVGLVVSSDGGVAWFDEFPAKGTKLYAITGPQP